MNFIIAALISSMTFSAFAVQVSKCPKELNVKLQNFVVYKKLAKDKKFENVLAPLENLVFEDLLTLSKKTSTECIYANEDEDTKATLFTKSFRDIEDGQMVNQDMLKLVLRNDGTDYTLFFDVVSFSKLKIDIYENMPGKINKRIYVNMPDIGSTALGMIDYKISAE